VAFRAVTSGGTGGVIPYRGHLAKYVNELLPNAGPANFDGKIEIVSSQPLVALTLRQNQTVFTSLPIIP
jgi:hypothetical protein